MRPVVPSAPRCARRIGEDGLHSEGILHGPSQLRALRSGHRRVSLGGGPSETRFRTPARSGLCPSYAHGTLRPLRNGVAPLRVAVHWPAKAFAEPEGGSRAAKHEVSSDMLGSLRERAQTRPGLIEPLTAPLCEGGVPLGPEEEVELDALIRQVREGAHRGGSTLSPLYALSFWLMKRRAGQVGERLGRHEALSALLPPVRERGIEGGRTGIVTAQQQQRRVEREPALSHPRAGRGVHQPSPLPLGAESRSRPSSGVRRCRVLIGSAGGAADAAVPVPRGATRTDLAGPPAGALRAD